MSRQYAALSGIAIFLIVLNHSIHFGLQVAPVEGTWLAVLILGQALGAFAVPAFLFISGAFLAYSAKQTSVTFVGNSLSRILWPYAIWSAIFYVIFVRPGGVFQTIAGYVWNLVIGFPYHFVPLLVLCYLTAPLLIRAGRRWGLLVVAAIGVYQALLLGVRFAGPFGLSPAVRSALAHLQTPILFEPLAQWAVYFPLGLVIGLHDSTIRPRLLRLRAVMVAVTAALFVVGMANALGFAAVPWARFLAPLPMMCLLPVISRNSIPMVARFEGLGRRSYGIYFVHFVVLNLLVQLVAQNGAGATRLPALIVIPGFLVATLASSLFLMAAMERSSITRHIYRHLFGIGPSNPRPSGRVARPPVVGGLRTEIAKSTPGR